MRSVEAQRLGSEKAQHFYHREKRINYLRKIEGNIQRTRNKIRRIYYHDLQETVLQKGGNHQHAFLIKKKNTKRKISPVLYSRP